MDLSFLVPGAVVVSRDNRFFTVLNVFDDCIELKYGPGCDERSFWNLDGSIEYGQLSDADVVSVLFNCLF